MSIPAGRTKYLIFSILAAQLAFAALVLAETEEAPALREVTGPFIYVRLRKQSYRAGELEDWARWLLDRPFGFLATAGLGVGALGV